MATIIKIKQGGTGVQSVAAIKELLGLKSAAYVKKSDNYADTSHDSVPSSYALSEALRMMDINSLSGVIPISRGGTGATTAEEARINLGLGSGGGGGGGSIPLPVSIENGGTGAVTAETARLNLGLHLPLPLTSGGTGGNTRETAIRGLFGEQYIPVSLGGTGGSTPAAARSNLGINLPLSIENGGTGVSSVEQLNQLLGGASKKLEIGTDFNTLLTTGFYCSAPDEYVKDEETGETTQTPVTYLNAPPMVPDPIDRFNLVIVSSVDSEGASGYVSQLFMGAVSGDDDTTYHNLMYYRSAKIFGAEFDEEGNELPPDEHYIPYFWTDWVKVYNGTSIKISGQAPTASSGVDGDIWIQYV